MAITHVSTSSSSTQGAGGVDNLGLTFNLSGATGRKIFVRFGMDQTTPFGDVDTVTFDGQACTFVGEAALDNGSFETTVYLYYYDVPDGTSSGNKTAEVTFTDTTVDIALVVSEFTGVALGDPDSADFDEVTSGNTSCSLTAPSGNSIGVDVAAANVIANLTVAGTDQVERVEVDVDDYTLSTSETSFSSSGSKTMSWSYSTGGRRVQVAGLWAEATAEIGLFTGSSAAASPTAAGEALLSGRVAGDASAAEPTAAGVLKRVIPVFLGTASAATATAQAEVELNGSMTGQASAAAPGAVGTARLLGQMTGSASAVATTAVGELALAGALVGQASAQEATAAGVSRLLGKLAGTALTSGAISAGEALLAGRLFGATSAQAPAAAGVMREVPEIAGKFLGTAGASPPVAFGTLLLDLSIYTYPFEPGASPNFSSPFASTAAAFTYPKEPSTETTPAHGLEPSVTPPFTYPLE